MPTLEEKNIFRLVKWLSVGTLYTAYHWHNVHVLHLNLDLPLWHDHPLRLRRSPWWESLDKPLQWLFYNWFFELHNHAYFLQNTPSNSWSSIFRSWFSGPAFSGPGFSPLTFGPVFSVLSSFLDPHFLVLHFQSTQIFHSRSLKVILEMTPGLRRPRIVTISIPLKLCISHRFWCMLGQIMAWPWNLG